MGLQSFERSVERMVDGVFARAFRSQIKPIELGRRLIREMDDHRSVDVRGRTVVPNAFTFYLSPRDLEGFADVHDALIRELSEACVEYAADEGYGLMGPVTVELVADEQAKPGRFTVSSRMVEPKAQGALVLPSGERRMLGDVPFRFGRMPENDLVIADPERQPPSCGDPAHRAQLRDRRPRLHQRHEGQRRDGVPAHAALRGQHQHRRHHDPVRGSVVAVPD